MRKRPSQLLSSTALSMVALLTSGGWKDSEQYLIANSGKNSNFQTETVRWCVNLKFQRFFSCKVREAGRFSPLRPRGILKGLSEDRISPKQAPVGHLPHTNRAGC